MESAGLTTIKEVPGKGLGLVASTFIARGTRVLAEAPLLRLPCRIGTKEDLRESIDGQFENLTDDERRDFWALNNAFWDEGTREVGILRGNAFPLTSDDVGIFIKASRINHACINNANQNWNENLQRLTIHAARDIEEGEEITIQYLNSVPVHDDRQAQLYRNHRFHCSCHLCSLDCQERFRSDCRLEEMELLNEKIVETTRDNDPGMALHIIRRLLQLCDVQGLTGACIARAYYDAFQVAISNGDQARAKVLIERTVAERRVMEGDDSPGVQRLQGFAEDPTSHSAFGLASIWETAPGDVPSGLCDLDFEAWLWRGRDGNAGAVVSLEDPVIFPSIRTLPEAETIDPNFYRSTANGLAIEPRRHWVLLCEIEKVTIVSLRLCLHVKDSFADVTRIWFYTDEHGAEMDTKLLKAGHTVAILYAQRHDDGIHHDSPGSIKIFPVSMREFFELGYDVKRSVAVTSGDERFRWCQGCANRGKNMRMCKRCGSMWYCDRACQVLGWKEKGHKEVCGLLQERDVCMLMTIDQSDFKDYLHFQC